MCPWRAGPGGVVSPAGMGAWVFVCPSGGAGRVEGELEHRDGLSWPDQGTSSGSNPGEQLAQQLGKKELQQQCGEGTVGTQLGQAPGRESKEETGAVGAREKDWHSQGGQELLFCCHPMTLNLCILPA